MADISSLNPLKQCRELGVPLWSCPQFLFLLMGIIIVGTILLTYNIGQRYVDTEVVALIVVLLSGILFVISYVIVQAFEQVVTARQHALDQARKIIQLKDQFVFIATHELRSPANAIKWGLGSLVSTLQKNHPELYEEQEKLLTILNDSNERLLFLVHDLLEVARIENHTIKVKQETIHVREALTDAHEELAGMLAQRQVAFHDELPDLPAVVVDPMRIKEVFANLISNAAKYNNAGGNVWVRGEADEDAVTIHVTDDGIGIDRDEQDHVFEKFWRARRAEAYEGSGLGLFITKRLVELQHGTIRFTSTPNEGTTFSFTVPREGSPLLEREPTDPDAIDVNNDVNNGNTQDARKDADAKQGEE